MGKYCVIGKSLPHTLSPQIHKAFGTQNYCVEELEDADALKRLIVSRCYDGANVTIPYKETVIPFLDEIDEFADSVGAVNTVVNENGRIKGYNTDVAGMTYALNAAGIALNGRNVMILGSGGTCKTAICVCKNLDASNVYVVSRSGSLNYDNCYLKQDTQVIINTTPVGMMPNSYCQPINLKRFERLESVFDCIYNPLETLLVKQAKLLGLSADNGLRMLVEQARIAHNLYAAACGGTLSDTEGTEKVLRRLTHERRNIVLIGMAGSGKSTIGREVAKRLGREFFDTDEMIVKSTGRSIPRIFEDEGEARFRQYEAECVKYACSKLGAVIATGGGAVLDECNRFFMKANGCCVLIMRHPDLLATDGRPLSDTVEKAKILFEKRRPLYIEIADATVLNDADIMSAADRVIAITENDKL